MVRNLERLFSSKLLAPTTATVAQDGYKMMAVRFGRKETLADCPPCTVYENKVLMTPIDAIRIAPLKNETSTGPVALTSTTNAAAAATAMVQT
jgi:hypothetical protein